jgi:hypothetical protein
MTVVVVVVALVVMIATYVTWLARRLDRLAYRVRAARAGLLDQLVDRADAARVLGERGGLPDLSATAARAAAGHARLRPGGPLDAAVEDTENTLSRALRASAVVAAGQHAPAELHAVDSAAARVALARQLHNDAVSDVRALRGRRLVRVLRLAGRHPLPAYFEIDDTLPVRSEDPPPVRSAAPPPVEPVEPVAPVPSGGDRLAAVDLPAARPGPDDALVVHARLTGLAPSDERPPGEIRPDNRAPDAPGPDAPPLAARPTSERPGDLASAGLELIPRGRTAPDAPDPAARRDHGGGAADASRSHDLHAEPRDDPRVGRDGDRRGDRPEVAS